MTSQNHGSEHRAEKWEVRARALLPREQLMLEAMEHFGENGRNLEEKENVCKMLCSRLVSHLALRT